eukprot:4923730-Pleurochrysis_carterae.AAC.10
MKHATSVDSTKSHCPIRRTLRSKCDDQTKNIAAVTVDSRLVPIAHALSQTPSGLHTSQALRQSELVLQCRFMAAGSRLVECTLQTLATSLKDRLPSKVVNFASRCCKASTFMFFCFRRCRGTAPSVAVINASEHRPAQVRSARIRE